MTVLPRDLHAPRLCAFIAGNDADERSSHTLRGCLVVWSLVIGV
jgi:hypothetical protein